MVLSKFLSSQSAMCIQTSTKKKSQRLERVDRERKEWKEWINTSSCPASNKRTSS